METKTDTRPDYITPRKCPDCSEIMEHSVDIERDESFVRRTHIYQCPKCGYIHTEEAF